MRFQDACNLLNLDSDFCIDELKLAFRAACKKYHPDINAAGEAMMKMVNDAYETLEKFQGPRPVYNQQTEEEKAKARTYGDELLKAMNLAKGFGLEIEICGNWAWLHGNTKEHKEALKAAGFKWAPNKLLWYYRPEDFKSANRGTYSMADIRKKYGSDAFNGASEKKEKSKEALTC